MTDIKTIIVHSGAFHADELFAVATTLLLLKKRGVDTSTLEIIRTRDEEIISKGDIVLDVGGIYDPESFRFDHHQQGGAGTRENGIPYAAFGLAWRAFGEEVTGGEYSFQSIDEKLVQTIDALDNGIDIFGEPHIDIGSRYILQSALHSLAPTWKEKNYSMDEAFFRALEIVKVILDREIIRALSEEEGRARVVSSYEATKDKHPHILILDANYPYGAVIESLPEVQFVVKPSEDDSSWKVRTVQSKKMSFQARTLFPEEWAGKRGYAAAEITGVADALFIHNKRFIAVASSKEGALALAQKSLKH